MKQTRTLVERFDHAWHAWNQALDGLADADFELSVYPRWRLKDLLGHVYSYTELMRRHVESYKKRKRLASPRAPSYAYFNRREAEHLRQRSAADLRVDLESAYRRLRELVPTLTDGDLKQSFPSQWWNSNGRTTLRGILREEANHLGAHAEDVRKWRVREHVGG